LRVTFVESQTVLPGTAIFQY